ncbi:uncharacterized protein LOC118735842 [Rhagoletis pomonella]|uniref:uncharacterized protein LOC118735842 n=1 Tax=Rhagoletis pomonella TaxID=28610 RepID=UPI001781222D|nr:uncharacterized protein LOC118735842 [Rhagoletis pomonella]
MWRKATFLLLLSCILLQIASARHLTWKDDSGESDSKESNEKVQVNKRKSSDESSNDSDSSEEHASHGNLLNEFLKNYSVFIKSVTEKEKSVAKNFIENKLVSKVRSPSMNAVKESFSKYINEDIEIPKRKDADSILRYLNVSVTSFSDFLMLVDKYSPQSLREPNAEEVLIQEALQEAGVDNLLEDVPNRFEDFYKTFGEKVRSYIRQLTAVERENEIKLVDWSDEFSSAKGFENKIKEIRQFFSVYNPNEV